MTPDDIRLPVNCHLQIFNYPQIATELCTVIFKLPPNGIQIALGSHEMVHTVHTIHTHTIHRIQKSHRTHRTRCTFRINHTPYIPHTHCTHNTYTAYSTYIAYITYNAHCTYCTQRTVSTYCTFRILNYTRRRNLNLTGHILRKQEAMQPK